jgi:hypothetical protein
MNTMAFFGIYLGRGRPSRSQVFTLELFPGGRQCDRNSEKLPTSQLNERIGLVSTLDNDP